MAKMRGRLTTAIVVGLGLIVCTCSTVVAALPAANHPIFFGYWHAASAADGQQFNCDDYYSWEPTVWAADAQGNRYYKTIINHDQVYPIPRGSFDYFAETLGFTNGYVSESRDTSDLSPGTQDAHLIWEALWVARQVETMDRAVLAGKDIYWEVRMPFLGITGTLAKIIVAIKEHDIARPEAQIWPRVKYIDVADSPKNPDPWTASNIDGHITTMVNKLALYGMSTAGKLCGITVDDEGFAAAKASTADFVQINAYLDAPATSQQDDTQQWANDLDAALVSYISQLTTAGKITFLRLQGSDSSGCWHDMNTVAELNRVAYRRAATNTNVIGLAIWNWAAGGPTTPGTPCPCGESPASFAWGSRPDGPRNLAPSTRLELRSAHQEIYQAITGIPPDLDPPAPVSYVGAVPGTTTLALSWTNPPTSDYTGVMIRRKLGSYPTGLIDGSFVVDKAGSPSATNTHTDTGLISGITYFYSFIAHDASFNYATKVDLAATLDYAGYTHCSQEPFAYANGNLSGVGGWTGTATSSIAVADGTVKITAGATEYSSAHPLSCGAGTSGIIRFTMQIKSGSGSGGFMWSVWIDDPAANNLARWYGSYNSVIGRRGGTSEITSGRTLTGGWDNLEVRINTVTDMSEFFFNGSSMGSLSHAGAGDTAGSVWFDRWDRGDLAGSTVYFDNMTVGPYDDTPPAAVTSFAAIAGDGEVNLSWQNPPDGDFRGTMIRCKTTGYPTSAADGTSVVDKVGVPNGVESCVHTPATNGVTYYCSAFAHDPTPNYASPAQATATPTHFDAYDAKITNDGQTVVVTAGVVSADFTDFFYVQTPYAAAILSLSKGPAGLRVNRTGHGMTAGHAVGVRGILATDPANSERVINANWVKSYDDAAVGMFAMSARPLGGADWTDGPRMIQAGVFDPYGPNSVGLLVRAWGKVTQRNTSGNQYFYVDDGSGLLDGTQTSGAANAAVRVKANPSAVNTGDFVLVTGISTLFKDASIHMRRQILPLTTGGVQKLSPYTDQTGRQLHPRKP